jgi:hypothetical protein
MAATRPRPGVGRERVSFKELAIDQLGAVNEGLLEYDPRVAQSTMIEVKVQAREYVLAPAEVRRLEAGDFYFVPGSARKASGSFYTRVEIVECLLRHALCDLAERLLLLLVSGAIDIPRRDFAYCSIVLRLASARSWHGRTSFPRSRLLSIAPDLSSSLPRR